ncbi:MAG TPA: helix-turn-helix domain-containing protein [Caulobacteraceae bacterium]|nr:helix-turn-helix domain-containing protein [Caulobacteraceae bacterium]
MAVTRLDKDTPKSRRTRERILDSAMRLFAEVGYHAATNAAIADASGLTRGAMLYHFPTREELIEAAVAHIQAARLRLLDEAAGEPTPGADATAYAIEAYWKLLSEAPFVAFAELQATARTDAMVRERLAPAEAEFDRLQVGVLAMAGQGERFQASRDLARLLLEGLARATLAYDREVRTRNLLDVVERAVRMLNRKGAVQDLWPD